MNITVIGVSTGGPGALRELFVGMARLETAILLVQHMPHFINESVRRSIASLTDMSVQLATTGDRLSHGSILMAPSGMHMDVQDNRRIQLTDGQKVNYVCPAIDVTMMALKPRQDDTFVGVILTGMGRDGAAGIAHVKSLGGMTIVQDEATSTIFGMPKAAIETGAVDFEGPPAAIGAKLQNLFAPQTCTGRSKVAAG